MSQEMNQETERLLELMSKSLSYTPIVYQQNNSSATDVGTKYVLDFKHTSIPTDALMFFIPKYTSGENAKLVIRTPTLTNTGYVYYEKEYTIMVETNKGTLRTTKAGDIVGYRMCIFRFTSDASKIILVNSPLFNDASFTNLTVKNCQFSEGASVYDADDNQYYALVNKKEYEELKARVEALERKFIYGTVDAEEALADKEEGTIYIKVEG